MKERVKVHVSFKHIFDYYLSINLNIFMGAQNNSLKYVLFKNKKIRS